jgi:hypothetical protein
MLMQETQAAYLKLKFEDLRTLIAKISTQNEKILYNSTGFIAPNTVFKKKFDNMPNLSQCAKNKA